MPFAGTAQQPPADFEDDFTGETLDRAWTWNYTYCDVIAQLKGGSLLLSGTGKGARRGAALCLRPAATDYDFTTVLSSRTAELAGLTFYGNDDSHVVLGRRGNRLQLVSRVAGNDSVWLDIPCRSRTVHLKASVSEGCRLSFAYSDDGVTWTTVGADAPDGSQVLSWDRISRPGLYSDAPSSHPARFDSFRMLLKP